MVGATEGGGVFKCPVARCRLCAGVGAVVCVGGAVALLDGEADLIPPLLLLLLLQLLLLPEGMSLHRVLGGQGGVAAYPVLLQGGAPRRVGLAGELQPLSEKRREREGEGEREREGGEREGGREGE